MTPESLKAKGLIRSIRKDVKLLGVGRADEEAHRSPCTAPPQTAREKVEAAGGTLTVLREPKPRKPKNLKRRPEGRTKDTAPDARPRPSRRRDAPKARTLALAVLARQCVAGPGAPAPAPVHRGDPRRLPPRLVDARAGRRLGSDPELLQRPRRLAARPAQPLLRLALSRFSIFALGIMPYVTASIILQLLTVVIPQLEQLQKEGEAGYAKINQYTRYLTVCLAAAQATGYAYLFHRQGALPANPGRLVLIVVTLTAGTALPDVVRRADHEARHRQRHLAADLRLDPHVGAAGHQRLEQRRRRREAVLPADRDRRSSSRSSSSRKASGASRSSTRSAWSAAARPRAAPPTCRCA